MCLEGVTMFARHESQPGRIVTEPGVDGKIGG